eukprot:1208201-Rhodomonas_salina.2
MQALSSISLPVQNNGTLQCDRSEWNRERLVPVLRHKVPRTGLSVCSELRKIRSHGLVSRFRRRSLSTQANFIYKSPLY